MKKIILRLFICFAICNTCSAQLWCSPNSEWYYGRSWLTGSGYLKINYTGTTVTINNTVCNQLDCTDKAFYYLNNAVITNTMSYYTYEKDSIVYLYSPSFNLFDTLYNYKADIGESWLYPFYAGDTSITSCMRFKVTVIDTGHHVIQAVNLKWLKLNNNDTLFQKIGTLKTFAIQYSPDPCNYDYQIAGALRCYSDAQIQNYKRYSGDCDYFFNPIGLKEINPSSSLKLFPNPASNKIYLRRDNNLLEGSIELSIYNNLGILVRELIITTNEISIEDLPNGIYYTKLKTENYNFCEKFIINRL